MSSCFVSAWYLIRMKISISNANEAWCLFAKRITGRQITLTIAKGGKAGRTAPFSKLQDASGPGKLVLAQITAGNSLGGATTQVWVPVLVLEDQRQQLPVSSIVKSVRQGQKRGTGWS